MPIDNEMLHQDRYTRLKCETCRHKDINCVDEPCFSCRYDVARNSGDHWTARVDLPASAIRTIDSNLFHQLKCETCKDRYTADNFEPCRSCDYTLEYDRGDHWVAMHSVEPEDQPAPDENRRCASCFYKTNDARVVMCSNCTYESTAKRGSNWLDKDVNKWPKPQPDEIDGMPPHPEQYRLYIDQSSGGRKDDQEKIRMELIPYESMKGMAQVLTFGAKKYEARNWEKGIAYSRVYGAALRHLTAWFSGIDTDEETGLSHLHHASCCIAFLQTYVERSMNEFDDRPCEIGD